MSYLDAYAILSAGGMGGRNGFSLTEFLALSDRQILALLRIEWDEEGGLVREKPRHRRHELNGHTGRLSLAGRELASPESLGISEEELQWALSFRPLMVPVSYLSLFWSVWQKRGKSSSEIRNLWASHMASNN